MKKGKNKMLLDIVLKHQWLIEPEAFQQILHVVDKCFDPSMLAQVMHKDWQKYIHNGEFTFDTMEAYDDRELPGTRNASIRGKVALLPVEGPIFPRSNLMTMSGATSISSLMKDTQAIIDNPAIDTLILKVDSPGGNVIGINEYSNLLYEARNKKNIIAYVYGNAASAAYWIASSAQKIYVDGTGQLGSIGVVMGYSDTSKRDEKNGIQNVEIVSSQSPKKRLNPSTTEGKEYVQKVVNDLADVFVSTVARNRNVSIDTVLESFGQGGMIIAKQAISLGMADEISSLENVISLYQNNTKTFGGFMNIIELKEKHPDTYNAVLNEGKQMASSDLESKMATAKKEGAETENKRLKEIDALAVPGSEKVIAEHKYNMEIGAGDMAMLIVKSQKEKADKISSTITTSKVELGKKIDKIGTVENDPDTDANEEKAIEEAMISGMNTHRKNK